MPEGRGGGSKDGERRIVGAGGSAMFRKTHPAADVEGGAEERERVPAVGEHIL